MSPRRSAGRPTFAEEHVARRVTIERERRGWTMESLAQRLADVGCPMHLSALYKIEKSEPRRRITVDELIGFARAFNLPLSDLVRDPDELIPEELTDLHERLLLQQAVYIETTAAAAAAREERDRLIDEWNEAIIQAAERGQPISRDVIDRIIGATEDEQDRLLNDRAAEVRESLTSAIASAARTRKRGGSR